MTRRTNGPSRLGLLLIPMSAATLLLAPMPARACGAGADGADDWCGEDPPYIRYATSCVPVEGELGTDEMPTAAEIRFGPDLLPLEPARAGSRIVLVRLADIPKDDLHPWSPDFDARHVGLRRGGTGEPFVSFLSVSLSPGVGCGENMRDCPTFRPTLEKDLVVDPYAPVALEVRQIPGGQRLHVTEICLRVAVDQDGEGNERFAGVPPAPVQEEVAPPADPAAEAEDEPDAASEPAEAEDEPDAASEPADTQDEPEAASEPADAQGEPEAAGCRTTAAPAGWAPLALCLGLLRPRRRRA